MHSADTQSRLAVLLYQFKHSTALHTAATAATTAVFAACIKAQLRAVSRRIRSVMYRFVPTFNFIVFEFSDGKLLFTVQQAQCMLVCAMHVHVSTRKHIKHYLFTTLAVYSHHVCI
jgi:hypothetical protein